MDGKKIINYMKKFKYKRKFITFGAPNIEKEEIISVKKVMESGWLGTGAQVIRFENSFGRYKKSRNTVAVGSATAALHLSLLNCNLGPKDEVITTAMTFCSTVNAIIHSGAKPVLVDIDYQTGNIDVKAIKNAVNKNTKAIVPVHYAGRPCNMTEIMEIAKNNKLLVIEDCAHAVETLYKKKPTGTIGDYGCFSFYATKNLAIGEGGMIITKNKNHCKRLKVLSLHGMNNDAWKRYSKNGYNHYKVVEAGFKYNMTDMQAVIGIEQLKKISKNWKKRKFIWDTYYDELSKTNLSLTHKESSGNKMAYHLFPILLNKKIKISRDKLLIKLNKAGIGCGVHYESIPQHPFYKKKFGWLNSNTPLAYEFGKSQISLPITPLISQNDLDYIVNTVKKYI